MENGNYCELERRGYNLSKVSSNFQCQKLFKFNSRKLLTLLLSKRFKFDIAMFDHIEKDKTGEAGQGMVIFYNLHHLRITTYYI
jgi:hypothetical protein